MRCTVTHRGVPLVAIDIESEDRTLDLAPAALLRGYHQILAPRFRRAEAGEQNAENLARGWCMSDEARLAAEARVADSHRALAELAALEGELELRDTAGAVVPTDSIHVTELSFARPDAVTVFVQLRESRAPVPAVERPDPRGNRGATQPEVDAAGAASASPRQRLRSAV